MDDRTGGAIARQQRNVIRMRLDTDSFPPQLFEKERVAEAFPVDATDFHEKTLWSGVENSVKEKIFSMLAEILLGFIHPGFRCSSGRIVRSFAKIGFD
jgi:hypothetical protein